MNNRTAWRAILANPQTVLAAVNEGGVVDAEQCDGDDRWSQWAIGVCEMAVGQHDNAFRRWASLHGTGASTEIAGLAAAAKAAGLRQVDEHAAAIGLDEFAISCPGSARIDGLIGRAADEVGHWRPHAATGYLAQVDVGHCHRRDLIRLGWVRTEIALLEQRADDAQVIATRTVVQASQLGSERHLVKSRLFLAAALPTGPARLRHARNALAGAAALDLFPLIWPAVLVLADDASAAERALASSAIREIASHLPEQIGHAWRHRVDIAALAGPA